MASRSTRSGGLPPVQQPESQSRAKWTTPLTKILIDLLLDQICKGNRKKKSFHKNAWESVCDDFREKTGLPWDNEQLKSKYATLRKLYIVVKTILGQREFRWNEATGAIIASDEAWDTYIKDHPDCENLRSTGCPIYKELCSLFSLPTPGGKYDQTKRSNEQAGGIPLSGPHTQQEDSSSSGSEQVVEDSRKNHQPDVPKAVGQKRGRIGVDGAIAKAILEMAAASKLRTAAIKKFNGKFSVTDCVKALDELEGVNDEIYFAALDLFNNRSARETFLSLKIDKRLTWLSSKCVREAGNRRLWTEDASYIPPLSMLDTLAKLLQS